MTLDDRRLTPLFGALVFLFTAAAYYLTVQPTVSFWDCGEFIACSYTMGIPHPPGTPLFVIFGRVVSMLLFFIQEVAFRINLISVVGNSCAVVFVYLTLVRFLKLAFDPEKTDNPWLKLAPIFGAFSGALFVAYSYTWWFNCVEAEVYAIAMVITTAEVWLAFKWLDHKETSRGDQYLLLIMYLAYLGIGAHLYTVIPLPFVFLFVLFNKPDKLKHWQLWIIGFCLLSVMYSISSFIVIGPVLLVFCLFWIFLDYNSARIVGGLWVAFWGLRELIGAMPKAGAEFSGLNFVLGLAYLALAVLPYALQAESREKEKEKWYFCFWIVLAAFVGFSVHLVIPIRSFLDPMIDENNPEVIIKKFGDLFKKETWDQLIYFLERKQYGNESMVMRMFHRRGELFSQFINHKHMGFGGYLAVQYFNFKDITDGEITLGKNALIRTLKLTAYLTPLTFVIWAVGYQYKRNRNAAIFLALMFVACTVGLVMYMNFADGTVPENRDLVQWEQNGRMGPKPEPIQMEVRERDYFFTPGFMFFGMWMGIAMASLLYRTTERYRRQARWLAPLLAVLILASPTLPLVINGATRTRADNWVAYDYAYNLLQSCEKDGILFTNGDNDTFPLWFIQEVAGVRRDVRVVNLSLLNTNWYIAQLMDHAPKLDIPAVLFDENFRPSRVSKEQFVKEINHRRNLLKEPRRVKLSQWQLETDIPDRTKESFFRIQDYMVLNIVQGNAGVRPIYFAVTVSEGNFMGLSPYLLMEGLVYRLMPEKQTKRMDIERTLYNLDKVYRYTYLGDKDVFLDPNTEKLLSNYAASFIGYVYEDRTNLARFRGQEQTLTREVDSLKNLKKPNPASLAQKEAELAQAAAEAERVFVNIDRQLKRCVSILPTDWRARVLSAQMYAGDRKFDRATETLKKGLDLDPKEYVYLSNLGFLLRDQGKSDEALPYLERALYEGDPEFKRQETPGVVSALFDAYRNTKQESKSIALLEKWTAANPRDARARQMLEGMKRNQPLPVN